EAFVEMAPTKRRETVMRVVPILIHTDRKHRECILASRAGDEVIHCVACRISGRIRKRNVLEDVLRDRTELVARNLIFGIQRSVSLRIGAERVVNEDREALDLSAHRLRGEGLAKIAAPFERSGQGSRAARTWVQVLRVIVRKEEECSS